MTEPIAERPYIAHPEYGIPKDTKTLVEWAYVAERLSSERHYWVATASPEGVPRARPVWGVFVDDAICFGGGPKTSWSRNLEANPHVSLHLESGAEVVIAEGRVERVTDRDDPFLSQIDDAYEVKYEMRHGPPVWVLRPKVVLAWTEFPTNMTRFRF